MTKSSDCARRSVVMGMTFFALPSQSYAWRSMKLTPRCKSNRDFIRHQSDGTRKTTPHLLKAKRNIGILKIKAGSDLRKFSD